MICASYGSEVKLSHACNKVKSLGDSASYNTLDRDAKNNAPSNAKFIQRDNQIFRNARHKVNASSIGGKLIICRECDGFISANDMIDNFYRRKSSKRRVSAKYISRRSVLFLCIKSYTIRLYIIPYYYTEYSAHASPHAAQLLLAVFPQNINGTLLPILIHMTSMDAELWMIRFGGIHKSGR